MINYNVFVYLNKFISNYVTFIYMTFSAYKTLSRLFKQYLKIFCQKKTMCVLNVALKAQTPNY